MAVELQHPLVPRTGIERDFSALATPVGGGETSRKAESDRRDHAPI
jgi:hypothetical protein